MPHVPDTIEELKKVLPEMKTKRITYVAEFLARRYGYKPSTMELYIHKKMFGTFLDVAEILDRMDENDAIIKERKKRLPAHKQAPKLLIQKESVESQEPVEEPGYSKEEFGKLMIKVRKLASDHKDKNLSREELESLSEEFFKIVEPKNHHTFRSIVIRFLAVLYGYAHETMDSYYSMNVLGKYNSPEELIRNLPEVDKILQARKRRRVTSTEDAKKLPKPSKKTQSSDQLIFEIQKRERQVDKYNELVQSSTAKRDRYQKELDALKIAYDIIHGEKTL